MKKIIDIVPAISDKKIYTNDLRLEYISAKKIVRIIYLLFNWRSKTNLYDLVNKIYDKTFTTSTDPAEVHNFYYRNHVHSFGGQGREDSATRMS